ncbi:MAG: spore germination protein [Clostridiales bacterium]|nr:spore germination protein [Clostridiales bacterium]
MKKNLSENIQFLKDTFIESDELIVKEMKIGSKPCAIIYLLGLCDTTSLSKFVIQPIMDFKGTIKKISDIPSDILYLSEAVSEDKDKEIISNILKGKAILLVEGEKTTLILAVDKFKERAIAEPPTSTVLKGPRAGFVENLKTNLASIRKILATPKLKTINLKVGKHTDTAISIVYIDGIADKNIVDIVNKRLSEVNIDGIIDSYYIASYLEEHKNSMFKQIGNNEKPDITASKLLEGRIAIIVDGSPMVLTVPFVYLEDLQSGDDYYNNNARASFVRWIRILSIFVSILTPGLYIAIVLHHYKAIPLKFLITIVNTTKGLPLTPFAEILFVLLLFEILYEASLRMPKYLGLALSIVGALILGDTAVQAGLISPPAVMIVAISGLTIYCIPDQAPQLYILRMLYTFAGGMLGFFGIICLTLFLISYLSDFDNYGSPYFAPLSPFIKSDTKDFLYKTDLINMNDRPLSIKNNRNNIRRQRNGKDN